MRFLDQEARRQGVGNEGGRWILCNDCGSYTRFRPEPPGPVRQTTHRKAKRNPAPRPKPKIKRKAERACVLATEYSGKWDEPHEPATIEELEAIRTDTRVSVFELEHPLPKGFADQVRHWPSEIWTPEGWSGAPGFRYGTYTTPDIFTGELIAGVP